MSGRIPIPFDPAELAMLHETGYFGVSSDKLEEIADEMQSGKDLFDAAWDRGIDPANLSSEDRRTIRDLLNDEDDD